MLKKVVLFALYFTLISNIKAQYDLKVSSDEERQYYHDMGVRTAKQTWWFFDTILKNNDYGYKFLRVYLEFQEIWLKDISIVGESTYIGTIDTEMPFPKEIDVTSPIRFQGVEIDDWLMVDDYYLIGGFVLRSFPYEERTKLMKVGQFRTNCPAINDDFFHKSKMNIGKSYFPFRMDSFPFEGGHDGFYNEIQSEIYYPEYARAIGLEGYVNIEIIIEPSGDIKSVKMLRGIGGGLNDVAKEVIWNSKQKWRAFESNEDLILRLPIRFELR